ncbi:hypothetical protein EP12_10180 [Alteromonas australica]|nr:hypothetical protein EP12_10180 [Alteromonas australica]
MTESTNGCVLIGYDINRNSVAFAIAKRLLAYRYKRRGCTISSQVQVATADNKAMTLSKLTLGEDNTCVIAVILVKNHSLDTLIPVITTGYLFC